MLGEIMAQVMISLGGTSDQVSPHATYLTLSMLRH